jgi:hypothetical protein
MNKPPQNGGLFIVGTTSGSTPDFTDGLIQNTAWHWHQFRPSKICKSVQSVVISNHCPLVG